MSMLELTVPVTWYTAEDGSDVVLATDMEIAEEERGWRGIVERLEAMIGESEGAEDADLRRQLLQSQVTLASFDTMRQDIEVLRPLATTLLFVLRKPTLAEIEDALAEIETFDVETGDRTFDDRKYRRIIMPKCITFDEPILPVIEGYLWSRLKKASKGDMTRIPFFVSYATSGKTAKSTTPPA